MAKTILIVEDDPNISELVQMYLEKEGYHTKIAADGGQGVALFRAWRPLEGVTEAEQRDHVPYRDWERAGFLTLCQGDMIDNRDVIAAILDAKERYDLRALGIDQYLTATMTPLLQDEGVEIIAIPQTMAGMSPAMKELEGLIREHKMLHVHNTCARWCFGNVRCAVDGNENQKPMKVG